jgi:hypothetical protein
MARISLDPPRTLSYRIGGWFLRRQFGEVLDPYRAQGHNMPVARAFGKLEQSAAKWDKRSCRGILMRPSWSSSPRSAA